MLKNPAEYERDTSSANSRTLLAKFIPASLLGIPASICQRALANESGMIRTQMRTHNRSESGRSVWNALFDTTL
jgi:hypothetical protein